MSKLVLSMGLALVSLAGAAAAVGAAPAARPVQTAEKAEAAGVVVFGPFTELAKADKVRDELQAKGYQTRLLCRPEGLLVEILKVASPG